MKWASAFDDKEENAVFLDYNRFTMQHCIQIVSSRPSKCSSHCFNCVIVQANPDVMNCPMWQKQESLHQKPSFFSDNKILIPANLTDEEKRRMAYVGGLKREHW